MAYTIFGNRRKKKDVFHYTDRKAGKGYSDYSNTIYHNRPYVWQPIRKYFWFNFYLAITILLFAYMFPFNPETMGVGSAFAPKAATLDEDKNSINTEDGNYDVYMTPEDFVRSLTPGVMQPRNLGLDKFKIFDPSKHMESEFNDPDCIFYKLGTHGLINFSDYLFLMTLLSMPRNEFKLAFSIFDFGGDEELDKDEFSKVQKLLLSQTNVGQKHRDHILGGSAFRWSDNSAITQFFFGSDEKRKLKLETLLKFQHDLHRDILKIEFERRDPDSNPVGIISEISFAELLLMHAGLPEKRQQRMIKRVKKQYKGGMAAGKPGISFNEVNDFFQFLYYIDDVDMALHFYKLAGKSLSKELIIKVARKIAKVQLTDNLVDAVITLFDENGDGELSHREFVALMKKRMQRGLEKPKDTGLLKLVDAVWEYGVRIAGSTSIEHLLQLQSFSIRINDEHFPVEVPPIISKSDDGKKSFQSSERLTMLDDIKLKIAALNSVLQIDEFKLAREKILMKKLEEIEEELRPMEMMREKIERECQLRSTQVAWGGFIFMGVQTGILFRLTYFEYSWDVVEPLSYFVNYSAVLATLAYYLQFYKRAVKHNFNIQLYNELVKLRDSIKHDLDRLRDPLYQHLPATRLAAFESELAKMHLTNIPKYNPPEEVKMAKLGDLSLSADGKKAEIKISDKFTLDLHLAESLSPATSVNLGSSKFLKDTVYLGNLEENQWYGGPNILQQSYPLMKTEAKKGYDFCPYVIEDVYLSPSSGNERYWISSMKVAISVPSSIPLWSKLSDNGYLSLQAQYEDSPYKNLPRPQASENPFLAYTIVKGKKDIRLKDFHQTLSKMYLGHPKGCIDDLLIEKPIWTTWARYGKSVNQEDVLQFFKEIQENNFPVSQIELDDKWTTEYGDFEIDTKKFPSFKSMVSELNSKDVRLTAWIHPFVNFESKNSKNPDLQNFFVKELPTSKPKKTKWWNGEGYIIDFTNFAAKNWFKDNLKKLQENYGIFSFKFDAGEVGYLPENFELCSGNEPNDYSRSYAHLASEFGTSVEDRVGSGNQEFPILIRTIDRLSRWIDVGLATLIPSTLHFSLLGYYWNLPDIVGGNGYEMTEIGEKKLRNDSELFIRWVQANAFLLVLQFSFCPWDYIDSEKVTSICLSVLNSRGKFVEYMKSECRKSVNMGIPLIRPLWWELESTEAFLCDDEFLVGDRLLVAPVVREKTYSRKVILPEGTWQDERGQKFSGPSNIEIDVPIERIPHFWKVLEETRCSLL
ncbi:hypothetical protein FO519_002331 [Halicephalobus sp. NKZ332]|nr:hypothetical protein FO519_002331 [Halicephalobus sp. NKZ332]